MKSAWKIAFLNAQVVRELRDLPADVQAHYWRILEQIEQYGPQAVGMPAIRSIGNRLWEIRMKGKDGIARAIYIHAREQTLVVLHVFVKKTQKTPRQAIDLARKRAKESGLL